jgi:hypothetical protein
VISRETSVLSDQRRAYLEHVPLRRPLWERGIAQSRREMSEDALAVRGELEPIFSVTDVVADGVKARLYRPLGDERSVLPGERIASESDPARLEHG